MRSIFLFLIVSMVIFNSCKEDQDISDIETLQEYSSTTGTRTILLKGIRKYDKVFISRISRYCSRPSSKIKTAKK